MSAPMHKISLGMFRISCVHKWPRRLWHWQPVVLKRTCRCYSSEVGRRGTFDVDTREPSNTRVPIPQEAKPLSLLPKLEGGGDLLVWLQGDFDMSIRGFRNWFSRKNMDAKVYEQRYIGARNQILGAELSAAHFLVHRGASVRFAGTDQWVLRDERGRYTLPRSYVPNVWLEAIELNGMELMYEGLINIELLSRLRYLSLRNCKEVDDWYLDRVSCFGGTLEYLDLSGCVNLSERAFNIVPRMEKLKVLKLYDMTHIKSLKLICILLEESMPNLKIEGVDYMNPAVLELDTSSPTDTQLDAGTAQLPATSVPESVDGNSAAIKKTSDDVLVHR